MQGSSDFAGTGLKTNVFLSPKRDSYLSIFPVVHCNCSHRCKHVCNLYEHKSVVQQDCYFM